MDNDDRPVGRLLTRREVLKLLGGAAVGLLVGCGPEDEVAQAPALSAEAVQAAEVAPVDAANTAIPATANVPQCVVRPELMEGPYFVDTGLNRSDIRSDPGSGLVSAGVPLLLAFHVLELSDNACRPLPGAVVDVWHCDALGFYSGVTDPNFSTTDQAFLRGYQVADEQGQARFQTIYPGWYPGRATHIHFKVRTDPGAAAGYEFTSQLFFDEALTDMVHAQEPYAQKGTRNVLNRSDRIFHESLVLDAQEAEEGYAATFALALDLSDAATGRVD